MADDRRVYFHVFLSSHGGKCTASLYQMQKSAVTPPCIAHSTRTNKLHSALDCLRSRDFAAVPRHAFFILPL